jgi:hypothetical protein
MSMWFNIRQKGGRPWLAGMVVGVCLLAGCGGPDICECLEEADKENPDAAVMEQCREAFSAMEMDEVQEAVKGCGR